MIIFKAFSRGHYEAHTGKQKLEASKPVPVYRVAHAYWSGYRLPSLRRKYKPLHCRDIGPVDVGRTRTQVHGWNEAIQPRFVVVQVFRIELFSCVLTPCFRSTTPQKQVSHSAIRGDMKNQLKKKRRSTKKQRARIKELKKKYLSPKKKSQSTEHGSEIIPLGLKKNVAFEPPRASNWKPKDLNIKSILKAQQSKQS